MSPARIPVLMCLLLSAACSPGYDSIVFTVSQNSIVANGSIDASTLPAFRDAIRTAPQVDTLVL